VQTVFAIIIVAVAADAFPLSVLTRIDRGEAVSLHKGAGPARNSAPAGTIPATCRRPRRARG